MKHAEAVKLNSVERYVLGELTATERDAFEEHYFDCPDCAAEVKAAAAFIDNVRDSMRSGAVIGRESVAGKFWLNWLQPGYALAIIAGLVLVIGYQTFITIPRIRHIERSRSWKLLTLDLQRGIAQTLPMLSLTTSGARGEAGVAEIAVPPGSQFGILLDIPPGENFTAYSCAIRGGDGKLKLDIYVSAAQARDTVELFIPGSALDPGSYQLLIIGKKSEADSGEEIARYPFALKNVR